jgi:hypothetical protein
MFELRQFDLQLAFPRAGALRKDIENERRAIEHLALENFFQVARLRPSEFIVENDSIHLLFLAPGREFGGLASTNEGACKEPVQFLRGSAGNDAASGLRQLGKFFERILNVPGRAALEFHAHQEDPLGPAIGFNECFQLLLWRDELHESLFVL